MEHLRFYSDHSANEASLRQPLPKEHARLRSLGAGTQPFEFLVLKRIMDIGLSLALLALFSVSLFPVVSMLIALESSGGVFYIQRRTGRYTCEFPCFKFRTMIPETPGNPLPDDARVTRIGTILRLTHIDELPQLLNVLLGHMSLVGPRPHMLSDTRKFEGMTANYHIRHLVRPGITGLAQVNGLHGTVENNDHLVKRVQLDIEYVYTWTPWKDAFILVRTLLVPFKKAL